MTLNMHAPNQVQMVPMDLIKPSTDNVRLFVERQRLGKLRNIYRAHVAKQKVVLPDPLLLRFRDGKLELLAGERRYTAASLERVKAHPCRIVTLSDEQAYKLILAHNDVEGLTTVELAFRAAEMSRLGFTYAEIEVEMGGGLNVRRYVEVGALVNPDHFTDDPKLCDPSIIEWFEATEFGTEHFQNCFKHWNLGLWDEKQCAKEFRRRGKALPLDNAEKGFRFTRDGNRLVIRGQIDLDFTREGIALRMLNALAAECERAAGEIYGGDDFGDRTVMLINPLTVV